MDFEPGAFREGEPERPLTDDERMIVEAFLKTRAILRRGSENREPTNAQDMRFGGTNIGPELEQLPAGSPLYPDRPTQRQEEPPQ